MAKTALGCSVSVLLVFVSSALNGCTPKTTGGSLDSSSTVQPAAPPVEPIAAPAPDYRTLGVNLGAVNYYTSEVMFLDLMKQAQDWGLGSNGWTPSLDAQGWPTSVPSGYRVGFIARAPRPGRYVALWEGNGDFTVGYGGRVVSSAPNRLEMDLDGGETDFFITRSEATAPLRNVTIVPIANEQDHAQVLFDPVFIDRVKPFRLLRFMDTLRTNGSVLSTWADRPKPDDFAQGTEKGVALEYAIELCNRVRADCWLNVPHMADDGYVLGMAELVRDRLADGLKVYVEYSNEIWNFPHGDWVQAEGERHGLPAEWDTRLRYQAQRSVEIFDVFHQVVGPARVVRVLASQTWDLRLRIVAEWQDAWKKADALSVAPYFCDDLGNEPGLDTLTAAEIAQRCVDDVERIRQRVVNSRAVADDFGLPLIGYEGGQHLVTSGDLHSNVVLQDLLTEANREPAMGTAYTRYLTMWREELGGMLALYQLMGESSQWGRWGLLEDLDQDPLQVPKYHAVIDFMAKEAEQLRAANGG